MPTNGSANSNVSGPVAAADRWIVLELGPKAEGEDPDLIRRSIRHCVRDAEVFVPAAVTTIGDEKVVRYLVEGYAFIRRTQPDQTYMKLAGTRYVNSLLKTGRQLATVAQSEIDRMRSQVRAESEQGIGVGDTVLIMSGPYRQITAVVHEDIPELKSVQVFIRLRSKEALVTLPRNCLRLVGKVEQTASLETRATETLSWFQSVLPTLRLDPAGVARLMISYRSWKNAHSMRQRVEDIAYDMIGLDDALQPDLPPPTLFQRAEKWSRMTSLLQRRDLIDRIHRVRDTVFDLAPIRRKHTKLKKVSGMADKLSMAQGLVNLIRNPPMFDDAGAVSKLMEYGWFSDVIERLQAIAEEVQVIEDKLAAEDIDMDTHPSSSTVMAGDMDNLIIDGLNLAVRCCYAPGLSDLTDSKGRPTGAFFGFLNCLSSFRRRFPGARLIVVWDGSSKRRKTAFEGYKASRGSLPVTDWQLGWLKAVLPLLGVDQYWNPDEEADDVMGTLVRTTFKGKKNVVYSTDRDMMQLVSEGTLWMTPPVGKAKETVYDAKAVEAKWGVGPDRIVMLRALLGDTSDEIPGSGVPKPVAVNLVRAYESVERLYGAKLAGLTRLQYDKLKASEKLVRRNVELMTLRCDLPLSSTLADPDRTKAEERLRDVDVKPDNILATFFG